MREIKFRAWNPEIKKMGYTRDFFNDFDGVSMDFHGFSWDSYDEKTSMQYTGLKDKNGVEIYEGDLVRSIINDNIEEVRWINHLVDSIEFTDVNYTMGVGFCFITANSDELEVIGNIYQNPELLTK